MAAAQVAQYVSDPSDEEMMDEGGERIQSQKLKKRRTIKHWIKEEAFDSAAQAEASIGNTWSKYYTNYSEEGRRVYYRCKKAKYRERQCSASVHLLFHADSDKVSRYKTEADHDHVDENIRGIDDNVKSCIEELFTDGIVKPKQIIRALQARSLKVPTFIQLKNFLAQYKKKKYGSYVVSLGELEHWCENNSEVPTIENKPFVVSHRIIYDDQEEDDNEDEEEEESGNKFRLFISSVRLLHIASISSHIHADATYKLVWQGFPVLIVGTTDLNKTFHPFGLAICSNEKTKDFEFIFTSIQIGMQRINKDFLKPSALICDAADSIKNGFR